MILIIQNGSIPTCIGKYINQPFKIIKSYEENLSLINLDAYSGIIILGGPQRLSQGIPVELIQVIELIKKCLEIGKPLLGICLGCQLLAHCVGCSIISSGGLFIDYQTKLLNYEMIFRCHYDYIIPNNNVTVLDTFREMPYFIQINNSYGIQCHPDIPPEHVSKYLDNWHVASIAEQNSQNINQNNQLLMNYLLELLFIQK